MTSKSKVRALVLTTAAIGWAASFAYADLIHEWKLDETSGSSAIDSIGLGAANLGGSSSWTSAKINNGFKTSGSTLGYVNAGNVPVTGSFSVSCWVNPENVTLDWRNMVSKHDGAGGTKSFWIGQGAADGALRFGMYFDGNTEIALDTPAAIVSNGSWSLVTATWNEATKLQSIYVDGVLRASATRTGQSFATARSSNLLFSTNSTNTASGAGTGSWARFPGTLDDVAIWNNPMTSGEAKALHGIGTVSGLAGYDAQSFAALRQAYATNFPVQLGNMRWTRATGLNAGEGTVQQKPNGYVMQLDSAGVGVTSLSTVSLSYDPVHANLADTTNASENPGGSGPDEPAIHVFPNGTSEVDGLMSNSSIGSADIRPNGAVNGDVLVMLWLVDTQGSDDRAALRSELGGAGGGIYSVLDSSDPQWTGLAAQYSGFDTVLRFNNTSLVGAVNWDFATHTDIVVDRIAVSTVPEPALLAPLSVAALLAGRRRK